MLLNTKIVRNNNKFFYRNAMLLLVLCLGIPHSFASENTMRVGMITWRDIGTDPTLSDTAFPDIGGITISHRYTHFSPLIAQDSDGNIIPWMAESFEVSQDYKTVIFHIRKGIKFADGTLLNASIIKFNLDRIITYGWADRYAKNANVFKYYDCTEISDEYTIMIHYTQGWPDMLSDLCGWSCCYFINPIDVEPAWDIRGVLKPEKKYDGLGPYYVDENESIPKEKVVLKRRHSWRDDLDFHKPRLDEIVAIHIADAATEVMALEKGEIDYIYRLFNPPRDILSSLEKNPTITIISRPDLKLDYIMTSYWREPFNGNEGILLRKAISYALNREEIAKGLNGYAIPANDTIFFSSLWQDIPACCHIGYDYNITKAKLLLKEAGWNDANRDGILDKNGTSLKNLNFIITSSEDFAWMKDMALIVQSQLRKVGIDIQIQTMEWGAYNEAAKTGDYDLGFYYTNGRMTPPISSLERFSHEDNKGWINVYTNQNRSLIKLAQDAQTILNKEARNETICQICNILYDDAGVIPVAYEKEFAVMSNKVKGFTFGRTALFDHLEECSVEE